MKSFAKQNGMKKGHAMFKIDKLTPEMLERIPKIRDKWIKIGLSTDPIDKEKCKAGLIKAYNAAELKEPKFWVWLDSPLAGAIGSEVALRALSVLDRERVRDQVDDQVREQVLDKVRVQVRDQVSDQVSEQVRDQVYDQIRDKVNDKVYAHVSDQVSEQVSAKVHDRVNDQVRSQVYAQVRDQVSEQVGTQVYEQVSDQVSAKVYEQVGVQVRDQVYDRVNDKVDDRVNDKVRAKVYAKVREQVSDQVREQVSTQVYDQVRSQVHRQVSDQVRSQVYDQVYDQVRNQVDRQFYVKVRDHFWSIISHHWESYWLSFYDFFRPFLPNEVKPLCGIMQAIEHGGWIFLFKDLVVITNRPSCIYLDDNGRLHHESKQALSYNDGFGVYCWHGYRIPIDKTWVITNPEKITRDSILNESNAEMRRIMIEKIGGEKFVELLDATKVSEDRYGQLFKKTIDDVDIAYARVVNSTPEPDGSNKIYWLSVNPVSQTCHEAIGRSFLGENWRLYNPAIET